VKVDVKLFALAKDLAGTDTIELDVPEGADVADVRVALGEQVPALSALAPTLLVAVGAEYANDSMRLQPGREVACFPPVSGG